MELGDLLAFEAAAEGLVVSMARENLNLALLKGTSERITPWHFWLAWLFEDRELALLARNDPAEFERVISADCVFDLVLEDLETSGFLARKLLEEHVPACVQVPPQPFTSTRHALVACQGRGEAKE